MLRSMKAAVTSSNQNTNKGGGGKNKSPKNQSPRNRHRDGGGGGDPTVTTKGTKTTAAAATAPPAIGGGGGGSPKGGRRGGDGAPQQHGQQQHPKPVAHAVVKKKRGVFPSLLKKTKHNKQGAMRLMPFSEKKIQPPVAKISVVRKDADIDPVTSNDTSGGGQSSKVSSLTDSDGVLTMMNSASVASAAARNKSNGNGNEKATDKATAADKGKAKKKEAASSRQPPKPTAGRAARRKSAGNGEETDGQKPAPAAADSSSDKRGKVAMPLGGGIHMKSPSPLLVVTKQPQLQQPTPKSHRSTLQQAQSSPSIIPDPVLSMKELTSMATGITTALGDSQPVFAESNTSLIAEPHYFNKNKGTGNATKNKREDNHAAAAAAAAIANSGQRQDQVHVRDGVIGQDGRQNNMGREIKSTSTSSSSSGILNPLPESRQRRLGHGHDQQPQREGSEARDINNIKSAKMKAASPPPAVIGSAILACNQLVAVPVAVSPGSLAATDPQSQALDGNQKQDSQQQMASLHTSSRKSRSNSGSGGASNQKIGFAKVQALLQRVQQQNSQQQHNNDNSIGDDHSSSLNMNSTMSTTSHHMDNQQKLYFVRQQALGKDVSQLDLPDDDEDENNEEEHRSQYNGGGGGSVSKKDPPSVQGFVVAPSFEAGGTRNNNCSNSKEESPRHHQQQQRRVRDGSSARIRKSSVDGLPIVPSMGSTHPSSPIRKSSYDGLPIVPSSGSIRVPPSASAYGIVPTRRTVESPPALRTDRDEFVLDDELDEPSENLHQQHLERQHSTPSNSTPVLQPSGSVNDADGALFYKPSYCEDSNSKVLSPSSKKNGSVTAGGASAGGVTSAIESPSVTKSAHSNNTKDDVVVGRDDASGGSKSTIGTRSNKKTEFEYDDGTGKGPSIGGSTRSAFGAPSTRTREFEAESPPPGIDEEGILDTDDSCSDGEEIIGDMKNSSLFIKPPPQANSMRDPSPCFAPDPILGRRPQSPPRARGQPRLSVLQSLERLEGAGADKSQNLSALSKKPVDAPTSPIPERVPVDPDIEPPRKLEAKEPPAGAEEPQSPQQTPSQLPQQPPQPPQQPQQQQPRFLLPDSPLKASSQSVLKSPPQPERIVTEEAHEPVTAGAAKTEGGIGDLEKSSSDIDQLLAQFFVVQALEETNKELHSRKSSPTKKLQDGSSDVNDVVKNLVQSALEEQEQAEKEMEKTERNMDIASKALKEMSKQADQVLNHMTSSMKRAHTNTASSEKSAAAAAAAAAPPINKKEELVSLTGRSSHGKKAPKPEECALKVPLENKNISATAADGAFTGSFHSSSQNSRPIPESLSRQAKRGNAESDPEKEGTTGVAVGNETAAAASGTKNKRQRGGVSSDTNDRKTDDVLPIQRKPAETKKKPLEDKNLSKNKAADSPRKKNDAQPSPPKDSKSGKEDSSLRSSGLKAKPQQSSISQKSPKKQAKSSSKEGKAIASPVSSKKKPSTQSSSKDGKAVASPASPVSSKKKPTRQSPSQEGKAVASPASPVSSKKKPSRQSSSKEGKAVASPASPVSSKKRTSIKAEKKGPKKDTEPKGAMSSSLKSEAKSNRSKSVSRASVKESEDSVKSKKSVRLVSKSMSPKRSRKPESPQKAMSLKAHSSFGKSKNLASADAKMEKSKRQSVYTKAAVSSDKPGRSESRERKGEKNVYTKAAVSSDKPGRSESRERKGEKNVKGSKAPTMKPKLSVKTGHHVANVSIPSPAVDTAAVMASLEATLPRVSSPSRSRQKSPKKKARSPRKATPKQASPSSQGNVPRPSDILKPKFQKLESPNDDDSISQHEIKGSLPREIALTEFEPVSDLDQSIRHFPMRHVFADGSVDVSRLGHSVNGDDLELSSKEEGERDRYAPLDPSSMLKSSPREEVKARVALADSSSEEKQKMPTTDKSIEKVTSEDTEQVAIEVMLNTCKQSKFGQGMFAQGLLANLPWSPKQRSALPDEGAKEAVEEDKREAKEGRKEVQKALGALNSKEGQEKDVQEALIQKARPQLAEKNRNSPKAENEFTPRITNALMSKPRHFFADEGADTFSATGSSILSSSGGSKEFPVVLTRGKDPMGLKAATSTDKPQGADPPSALKLQHSSEEKRDDSSIKSKQESSEKKKDASPTKKAPFLDRYYIKGKAPSILEDPTDSSDVDQSEKEGAVTSSGHSRSETLEVLESIEVVADTGDDKLPLLTAFSDDSGDDIDRYEAVEQTPVNKPKPLDGSPVVVHHLPALLSTIDEAESEDQASSLQKKSTQDEIKSQTEEQHLPESPMGRSTSSSFKDTDEEDEDQGDQFKEEEEDDDDEEEEAVKSILKDPSPMHEEDHQEDLTTKDQHHFFNRLLQFGQDVLKLSPSSKEELNLRMKTLSPLSKEVLAKSIAHASKEASKYKEDKTEAQPEIIDLTEVAEPDTENDDVWPFDVTPQTSKDEEEKRQSKLDSLLQFASQRLESDSRSDDSSRSDMNMENVNEIFHLQHKHPEPTFHSRLEGTIVSAEEPASPMVVVQGTDISIASCVQKPFNVHKPDPESVSCIHKPDPESDYEDCGTMVNTTLAQAGTQGSPIYSAKPYSLPPAPESPRKSTESPKSLRSPKPESPKSQTTGAVLKPEFSGSETFEAALTPEHSIADTQKTVVTLKSVAVVEGSDVSVAQETPHFFEPVEDKYAIFEAATPIDEEKSEAKAESEQYGTDSDDDDDDNDDDKYASLDATPSEQESKKATQSSEDEAQKSFEKVKMEPSRELAIKEDLQKASQLQEECSEEQKSISPSTSISKEQQERPANLSSCGTEDILCMDGNDEFEIVHSPAPAVKRNSTQGSSHSCAVVDSVKRTSKDKGSHEQVSSDNKMSTAFSKSTPALPVKRNLTQGSSHSCAMVDSVRRTSKDQGSQEQVSFDNKMPTADKAAPALPKSKGKNAAQLHVTTHESQHVTTHESQSLMAQGAPTNSTRVSSISRELSRDDDWDDEKTESTRSDSRASQSTCSRSTANDANSKDTSSDADDKSYKFQQRVFNFSNIDMETPQTLKDPEPLTLEPVRSLADSVTTATFKTEEDIKKRVKAQKNKADRKMLPRKGPAPEDRPSLITAQRLSPKENVKKKKKHRVDVVIQPADEFSQASQKERDVQAKASADEYSQASQNASDMQARATSTKLTDDSGAMTIKGTEQKHRITAAAASNADLLDFFCEGAEALVCGEPLVGHKSTIAGFDNPVMTHSSSDMDQEEADTLIDAIKRASKQDNGSRDIVDDLFERADQLVFPRGGFEVVKKSTGSSTSESYSSGNPSVERVALETDLEAINSIMCPSPQSMIEIEEGTHQKLPLQLEALLAHDVCPSLASHYHTKKDPSPTLNSISRAKGSKIQNGLKVLTRAPSPEGVRHSPRMRPKKPDPTPCHKSPAGSPAIASPEKSPVQHITKNDSPQARPRSPTTNSPLTEQFPEQYPNRDMQLLSFGRKAPIPEISARKISQSKAAPPAPEDLPEKRAKQSLSTVGSKLRPPWPEHSHKSHTGPYAPMPEDTPTAGDFYRLKGMGNAKLANVRDKKEGDFKEIPVVQAFSMGDESSKTSTATSISGKKVVHGVDVPISEPSINTADKANSKTMKRTDGKSIGSKSKSTATVIVEGIELEQDGFSVYSGRSSLMTSKEDQRERSNTDGMSTIKTETRGRSDTANTHSEGMTFQICGNSVSSHSYASMIGVVHGVDISPVPEIMSENQQPFSSSDRPRLVYIVNGVDVSKIIPSKKAGGPEAYVHEDDTVEPKFNNMIRAPRKPKPIPEDAPALPIRSQLQEKKIARKHRPFPEATNQEATKNSPDGADQIMPELERLPSQSKISSPEQRISSRATEKAPSSQKVNENSESTRSGKVTQDISQTKDREWISSPEQQLNASLSPSSSMMATSPNKVNIGMSARTGRGSFANSEEANTNLSPTSSVLAIAPTTVTGLTEDGKSAQATKESEATSQSTNDQHAAKQDGNEEETDSSCFDLTSPTKAKNSALEASTDNQGNKPKSTWEAQKVDITDGTDNTLTTGEFALVDNESVIKQQHSSSSSQMADEMMASLMEDAGMKTNKDDPTEETNKKRETKNSSPAPTVETEETSGQHFTWDKTVATKGLRTETEVVISPSSIEVREINPKNNHGSDGQAEEKDSSHRSDRDPIESAASEEKSDSAEAGNAEMQQQSELKFSPSISRADTLKMGTAAKETAKPTDAPSDAESTDRDDNKKSSASDADDLPTTDDQRTSGYSSSDDYPTSDGDRSKEELKTDTEMNDTTENAVVQTGKPWNMFLCGSPKKSQFHYDMLKAIPEVAEQGPTKGVLAPFVQPFSPGGSLSCNGEESVVESMKETARAMGFVQHGVVDGQYEGESNHLAEQEDVKAEDRNEDLLLPRNTASAGGASSPRANQSVKSIGTRSRARSVLSRSKQRSPQPRRSITRRRQPANHDDKTSWDPSTIESLTSRSHPSKVSQIKSVPQEIATDSPALVPLEINVASKKDNSSPRAQSPSPSPRAQSPSPRAQSRSPSLSPSMSPRNLARFGSIGSGEAELTAPPMLNSSMLSPSSAGEQSQGWRSTRAVLDRAAHSPSSSCSPSPSPSPTPSPTSGMRKQFFYPETSTPRIDMLSEDASRSRSDDEEESSLLLALTRSEGEAAIAISSTDGSSTNTGGGSFTNFEKEHQAQPATMRMQLPLPDSKSHTNLKAEHQLQEVSPSVVVQGSEVPESVTINAMKVPKKEFTRSPRLQTVLERLRNRKRLADSDQSVSSTDVDPVDVDELFSRYDNIVKHMVVLDDARLQRAQEKQLSAMESVHNVNRNQTSQASPIVSHFDTRTRTNPEADHSPQSSAINDKIDRIKSEMNRHHFQEPPVSPSEKKPSHSSHPSHSNKHISEVERLKARVGQLQQHHQGRHSKKDHVQDQATNKTKETEDQAKSPGEVDFTKAQDDTLLHTMKQLSALDEVKRIKARVDRLHTVKPEPAPKSPADDFSSSAGVDRIATQRELHSMKGITIKETEAQKHTSFNSSAGEIIDVTDVRDVKVHPNSKGRISPTKTKPPTTGTILRSSSFGSENSTPSQKARDLRQQLDQALKTSAAIRSTQERLGAELTTFKTRFQHRGGNSPMRPGATNSPARQRVPSLQTSDPVQEVIGSFSPRSSKYQRPTVVAGSSGSEVTSSLSDSKPSPTATEATLLSGEPASHSGSTENSQAPIPQEIHRPLPSAADTGTIVSSLPSNQAEFRTPSPTFDQAANTFDKLVSSARLVVMSKPQEKQQVEQASPSGKEAPQKKAPPSPNSPSTRMSSEVSPSTRMSSEVSPSTGITEETQDPSPKRRLKLSPRRNLSPRSRATSTHGTTSYGATTYGTSGYSTHTYSHSRTTGSPMSSSTKVTPSVLTPIYDARKSSPRERHPDQGTSTAAPDPLAVALMDGESSSEGDELLSSSGELESTGSRTSTSGASFGATTDEDDTASSDDDEVKMRQLESIIDGLRSAEERKQQKK